MEIPDYLALSLLNQFIYCPRRFWLHYVQGEMEVNAPLLEGQLRHEAAHTPGTHTDERGRVVRSLYVWSDTHRVVGVADFVEEHTDGLIPVEHKRGRMGMWLNDHVQVCAQAMCLEERLNITIPRGEIFYWGNRRRETVALNDALRAQTIATIRAVFALLAQDKLPAPIDHPAKCRDCSLEPICMPRETLRLLKEEESA
ncbi:MAG: CRISPR-associated protein Cas4 [Anaerolineae bacterium]